MKNGYARRSGSIVVGLEKGDKRYKAWHTLLVILIGLAEKGQQFAFFVDGSKPEVESAGAGEDETA
jgi:hypothetical protein